jgi:hypothetical protein
VLLPFANFTVMEYTKQVNFCGSCHQAMQPYLDDMLKPGHQSLAALHFQDRFAPTQAGTECYSCHVDYGVHGTLVAKVGRAARCVQLYDRLLHYAYQTPSTRIRRHVSQMPRWGETVYVAGAAPRQNRRGIGLIPLWHHSLRNVPPSWHVSS